MLNPGSNKSSRSKEPYDPSTNAPFFINLIAIGLIVLALAILNWLYPGNVQQYQWLPFSMVVAIGAGSWIASYRPGTSWVKYFVWGAALAGLSGLFGSIFLYIVGVIKDFNNYVQQSSSNAAYFMLAVTESFMVGGLSVDRFVDPRVSQPMFKRIIGIFPKPLKRLFGRKKSEASWEKWMPVIVATITTTGVIVSAIIGLMSKFYVHK